MYAWTDERVHTTLRKEGIFIFLGVKDIEISTRAIREYIGLLPCLVISMFNCCVYFLQGIKKRESFFETTIISTSLWRKYGEITLCSSEETDRYRSIVFCWNELRSSANSSFRLVLCEGTNLVSSIFYQPLATCYYTYAGSFVKPKEPSFSPKCATYYIWGHFSTKRPNTGYKIHTPLA